MSMVNTERIKSSVVNNEYGSKGKLSFGSVAGGRRFFLKISPNLVELKRRYTKHGHVFPGCRTDVAKWMLVCSFVVRAASGGWGGVRVR